jgi:phosphoribosylanthranilate isomerase
VQLHGNVSRAAISSLPDTFRIIYAISVSETGVWDVPAEHLVCLRPENDFLLFDAAVAGSGKTIDWHRVKSLNDLKFFVAGGLTTDNVLQAIAIAKPFGVDVSSGVESALGEKSTALIKQWMNVVNGVNHG